ncbi:DUF1707 SHOCT-like domain-containing protein [Glycomyces salinus]|uniref:DUF1707 SHOCT-like domain-containing protein n=1 Tax=Glycomyces salinus TaxID=980294 RepID=UPI0018EA88F8|nr:DUF1707 domain-containing protein [Glycomyces salinus]
MTEPDPNLRISNDEREAIVARLHAAVQDGRLDLAEFDQRSREVYEAKTYAEVERLLADLPADGGAVAIPKGPGKSTRELRLSPVHGRAVRDGNWTVPSRIVVEPTHGAVKLDMREARFTSREVAIDIALTHASLTVVLPRGASAEEEEVQIHGGNVKIDCHGDGGPHLVVNGRNKYGRVRIRYERRFLWWRW